MHRRSLLAVFLAFVLFCGWAMVASARTIYIDNRIGNDVNNGLASTNEGLRVGPVKTFDRAIVLLETGDTLEIANNGAAFPYHDSLRLIGEDGSGVPALPLVINGNGAILDGSASIPRDAWEALGDGLWRFEPWKKGWYRLYRGEETLPEVASERGSRAELPAGHWTVWRGAIYYQVLPDEIPANEPFRIATREAGIFLYHVHHVIIRDLTIRRYHLDGINAHDQAGPVVLEGVRSVENARGGVFIGGTSQLSIRGGQIQDNRVAPIIVQELGRVEINETDIDSEPPAAE